MQNIPIILDPVFASGSGNKTSTQKQIKLVVKKLLQHCTIATPNTQEALQLAQIINPSLNTENTYQEIADTILSTGLHNLLITGTHDSSNQKIITHRLFSQSSYQEFSVPRLAGNYHGSGCTLTSAIAANLAHHLNLEAAIEKSLSYTQQSLEKAHSLGQHQLFPNRNTC